MITSTRDAFYGWRACTVTSDGDSGDESEAGSANTRRSEGHLYCILFCVISYDVLVDPGVKRRPNASLRMLEQEARVDLDVQPYSYT